MTQLSEAYVLGLLADLEAAVPEKEQELAQAKKRVHAVDAELGTLVGRLDEGKTEIRESTQRAAAAALELKERNVRIATLHQEIAGIQRRRDDLKREMDQALEDEDRRRLRRERAKLAIQIEDRQAELDSLRQEVEQTRATLQAAERAATDGQDRLRAINSELDKLQRQLPDPHLYKDLFELRVARAHCEMFLDRRPKAWGDQLRESIGLMVELHREMRAGKYRLDRNSELIGGRATATGEAVYGAVAIGDAKLAREVMELATEPSLFFHQIFNVFRVWCVGLYLSDRHRELRELLRRYQFDGETRGGYVQAFVGLLLGDGARFNKALSAILRYEWEGWQNPQLVRGAGVVSIGAVALVRLANERGLAIEVGGPTLPAELVPVQRAPARIAGRRRRP